METTDNIMTVATTPKRFRRCIIHIGTEKTGTTAIQTMLQANRKNLQHQGVVYPACAGKHTSTQWEFVAIAHTEPWKIDAGWALNIASQDDLASFRHTFKERLKLEFSRHPATDTLIISSEHFHSRLHSVEAIARLKAFLEPWVDTYHVVVYFRRQDDLAVSYVSTRLKAGVRIPPNHKLSSEGSRQYYEFDKVFDKWAKVFGKNAMRPRLYQQSNWENGCLLTDFQTAAELTGLEVENVPVTNVSLNRISFQFAQFMNSHRPNPPGPDRVIGDREALVHKVAALFPGRYIPFTKEDALEFYQSFSESNERLRESAFPNLPAPLFEENFDAYPGQSEQSPPKYEDAVEIIIKLWDEMAASHPAEGKSFTQRIKRTLKRLR